MLCPPDGHVAGVYARVDAERGVHKAPANETLRGTVGVERLVTDAQQAALNPEGVDVIRTFPGLARPVVWGARTTVRKDITDWTYVNVRRLLCYIEESIQESLRWAVFEPNDTALWQKLTRTVTAFLTGVWRDGALFGATAAEAFSVRCDAALNPPEERALGRLFLEVRVAPVRPAEFIVVRISLWDGGSEASE
jgi:phage tail sheath protein FI